MKFYIEFKDPQHKSVQCKVMQAQNEKELKTLFKVQHPECQMLKIEDY